MKPSLKEVKEYFKNAKEVKGNIGIYTDIISTIKAKKIYYDEYGQGYYIEDSNGNGDFCVYCCELNKYAEIISYKEETLPIPKSVLLQLAENNSFSESIIKKEFPQLFDSELEVGKWYKIPNTKAIIKCLSKPDESGKFECYGFDVDGEYFVDGNTYTDNKYEPATEQEVFEALKNEAVKRGFKEGVTFTPTNARYNVKRNGNNFGFDINENRLLYCNYSIFNNGTWSEIIDQPKEITISEIESILGYKILIKE